MREGSDQISLENFVPMPRIKLIVVRQGERSGLETRESRHAANLRTYISCTCHKS